MRNTLYTSLAAGAVLLMFSGQVGAVDQWAATGQTTCYDPMGATIACGSAVYPNQDFDTSALDPVLDQDVASEAGTVIDNVTGLQWARDGEISGSVSYANAQAYVASLGTAGYNDWRLPTVQELSTLVNSGYTYDELGTYGNFTMPAGYTMYWSSTPDLSPAATSGDYMLVRMRSGTVNGTSIGAVTAAYVLAVRNVTSASVYTTAGTPTGTVFDETTGLVWQQATAQSSAPTLPPNSHQFFWGTPSGCDGTLSGGIPTQEDSALCYCEELELAGYTDWRLPDRNELHSLFDYSQPSEPYIDGNFPDTQGSGTLYYYWASTTVDSDTDRAWAGNFGEGYVIKSTRYEAPVPPALEPTYPRNFVRCVRGRLYKIDSSAVGPGSITTSDAEEGPYGDTVAYTITANMGENILDVVVDGESQGIIGTYTFPATTAGQHSIVATFATTHTISVTNGTGCTIDPAGPSVIVEENADQSFTIDAIDTYSLADVLVDSVSQGAVATYNFTNVAASHTIETVCTQDGRYNLAVTVTGLGSVTSLPIGINCPGTICHEDYFDGTEVTLTATADAGGAFLGWSGDCTGTGTCMVTMDQARSVGANFEGGDPASGNSLILFQPAINNGANQNQPSTTPASATNK